MKILIFIVANAVLLFLLFWVKFESVNLSLGIFSFELSIPESQRELITAVQYIEGVDSDKTKSLLAAQALLNWEHRVSSQTGAGAFLSSIQHRVRNGERQEATIRRFYAKLFAKKMGKMTAAETELRNNLDDKRDCRDLLFLAQIMASQTPARNKEMVALLEEALETKGCKNDPATLRNAQADLHLRKGHILFNSGSFEDALESYLKVLEINTRSEAAFFGAAVSFLRLGRLQESFDYFDRVATYSTRDELTGDALYHKGILLLWRAGSTKEPLDNAARTKALEEALKHLDLAISVIYERFSGFPRLSPQKETLALRHYARAIIANNLGLDESVRQDLEYCERETGNGQLAATCRQILSGESSIATTVSIEVGEQQIPGNFK